ncbi:2-amino-3,7-dideoxy-D-threo-hept-6-ulosonate synthase [Dermacoccaceae bacterium W4C1]
MTITTGTRGMRLRRLYRHSTEGLLVTPLDHSIADGPVVPSGQDLDSLVRQLAIGGADAVVLHKGAVRMLSPERLFEVALIVHLNASTALAPDPDAKVLVTSVEEAIQVGADAVSVHVNLGSATETQQLRDLSAVSRECERWGLPLLAMIYPRGPRITRPDDPELVLRAITVGADLGADLVKTVQVPDQEQMREVISRSPVPVLIAGGPPRERSLMLRDVTRAKAAGVRGVAMGRCLFSASDPVAATAAVAAVVHDTAAGQAKHLELHHDERRTHPYFQQNQTNQENDHVNDTAVLA